ncbi:MAG: 1-(5-phosphoribosyl)-5-[(5-phosphoribosylamino)methylideneamino]imidazole-4-carboxamide isomerase [Alphaproteobacteria bacterium]|nr:1-(5-phosphoribosyl)-5-[(5-phosphoribosylamino)methylideneamino]imidazole-4-carboxamide isomerase [Alphaproteobacteria bacterium]
MILFPAIDLKDGKCVRLLRGEMDAATVFSDDPAAKAREFEALGFEYLHLVDLNGAFEGKPVNASAVKSILQSIRIPVQLGGGIRDMATVEHWLALGVSRVILGTVALKDPTLTKAACKAFPGRIVLGIDARHGKVAVEGWAETSDMAAPTLAKAYEQAGAAAIIYTDIGRDGAMAGPNIEETVRLAQSITTPVIASGGVSSIDDLKALKAHEKDGITGVISGRAIYDGRIDPKEALALMRGSR